jgi:cysteine synthase
MPMKKENCGHTKKARAILLLSGGLDSTLAGKLLLEIMFSHARAYMTESKASFVADVLHMDLIDKVIKVGHEDAGAMGRKLIQEEGILAGILAGEALWAAPEVARRPENEGKLIVIVLPATGESYLSTWLFEEGE